MKQYLLQHRDNHTMQTDEVIIGVVGSWFLVIAWWFIKIWGELIAMKVVKRRYALLRLWLSFITWCLIWFGAMLMWYQPFRDIVPYVVLVMVGISLDILLKEAPAKAYLILSRIFKIEDVFQTKEEDKKQL